MKIIKADAKLLKHDKSAYEMVEQAGRICYKSEDKITEGSAAKFVSGLFKSRHMAMLEHEHIYAHGFGSLRKTFQDMIKYCTEIGKYLNTTSTSNGRYYVSGSMRAWREIADMLKADTITAPKKLLDDFEEFFLPLADKYPEIFGDFGGGSYCIDYFVDSQDEFIEAVKFLETLEVAQNVLLKHCIHTVVFTTDRGVTHELVRHRLASYAMESSRYCNYSKGKFGEEITIIDPCFWEKDSVQYKIWKNSCENAEKAYFELLNEGARPEEARDVLPNSLKADIVVTATEQEWQHIINLRLHGTTGAPHPQIKEIMEIALPQLIEASEGRIV